MKTRTLGFALALAVASEAGAADYCIYRDAKGGIVLTNQAKAGSVAEKCLALEDRSQAEVERSKETEAQGYKEIIAERLERERIEADKQVAEAVANQPQPEPQWMPMFPLRNGNVVFQGGFRGGFRGR